MWYPNTDLAVASSTKELRQVYLAAKQSKPCGYDEQQMQELETIAEPTSRARYDEQLGFDGAMLREAVASQDGSWFTVIKYGAGILAFFTLLVGDNLCRLYGYVFAPDFKEHTVMIEGSFEKEDGFGRVTEVSDHAFISDFYSSSKVSQFILKHPLFALQLPSILVLWWMAANGSKAWNRFVAGRITEVRLHGEDDTSTRRRWVVLSWLAVLLPWLVLFLFGYDRLVPVSP
jgi:hypothetical protein